MNLLNGILDALPIIPSYIKWGRIIESQELSDFNTRVKIDTTDLQANFHHIHKQGTIVEGVARIIYNRELYGPITVCIFQINIYDNRYLARPVSSYNSCHKPIDFNITKISKKRFNLAVQKFIKEYTDHLNGNFVSYFDELMKEVTLKAQGITICSNCKHQIIWKDYGRKYICGCNF